MEGRRREGSQVQLGVTEEEARQVASLLRYAVSLNTTVGLVSPVERRLATPTYRAAELAARVLEGKSFQEAAEESERAWTGTLQEDHRRALKLLEATRADLQRALAAGSLTPQQLAEYLEVAQDQLLELVRPGLARPGVADPDK